MKERDQYMDSMKGFLIILVVIGHFIETTDSTFNVDAHNFIYLFHMPMFVFISGYFGIIKDGFSLFIKSVTLLETFIVFQIIYLHPLSVKGIVRVFTEPYCHLWYIFSLLVWRIVLYYIPSKYIKQAILFSFIIGLIAGFYDSINLLFSLSRIIVFLPFFLLGAYARQKGLMRQIKKFIRKPIAFIIACLVLVLIILYDNAFGRFITGAFPYSFTSDIVYIGMLQRVLFYVVSLLLGTAILSILPPPPLARNICNKSDIQQ